MSAPRFPWDDAMTIGLGRLRLPPEIFWRMTLPELAAAARALQPRNAPMLRDDLVSLIARFPDGHGRAAAGSKDYPLERNVDRSGDDGA